MKMHALLIGLVGAFAVPVAVAAEPGWYAGAGGGWTRSNVDAVGLAPRLPEEAPYTVTSFDRRDNGWKAFAGYQFHENFGVEGIYASLGKYTMTARIHQGTANETDEYAEAKPDAWCVAGVGTLPLPKGFSLLGKLGLCRWDDHPRITEGAVQVTERVAGSTGTDAMYGLGARYDFTRNLGMRLEWERYTNVIHGRKDVDLYSLNLQYSF